MGVFDHVDGVAELALDLRLRNHTAQYRRLAVLPMINHQHVAPPEIADGRDHLRHPGAADRAALVSPALLVTTALQLVSASTAHPDP